MNGIDYLLDTNAIIYFLAGNSQNVKEYIIQGRLMNDKIIPWKARPRYEWT